MPANRTQKWSTTPLSQVEASTFGEAIGSETGGWYGGVSGAASSVTLGLISSYINGSLGLRLSPLMLVLGSVSYFLGSYFGAKQGAAYCKKVIEDSSERTSYTNQSVEDLCSTSVLKFKVCFVGFLVGAIMGMGGASIGERMMLSDNSHFDTNLLGEENLSN